MGETRPLGEQERLLNYLHAFGGLICLQVLHLRGRIDPALVRDGLRWLQAQHPILRAHIRYGGLVFRRLPPFVYRQPWFDTRGTSEIPLRVVDDVDPDAWQRIMARELKRPIRNGRRPRLRLTLVRSSTDPASTKLIISADHATLDAQSGNMIARQLLEFLADPQAMARKTPVHTTLPPPLEAGLPKKPSSGTRGYEPAMRLPALKVDRGNAETRIHSRHLGAHVTTNLKAAIKANRTTLHGAVTAAFLCGMHERYGLDAMTVLTTIDLRRLSKPALPAETYGCYIDILRTRHDIAGDFWSVARDTSFRLITTLAKDQESASIMKLPEWEVYAKETLPTLTHHRRIDGLAVTTAGESGLRRSYGPFELDDVTMAVSLHLFGPSLFVIASEREAGVDLAIGYAADAIDASEVRWLSDRAIALLEATK